MYEKDRCMDLTLERERKERESPKDLLRNIVFVTRYMWRSRWGGSSPERPGRLSACAGQRERGMGRGKRERGDGRGEMNGVEWGRGGEKRKREERRGGEERREYKKQMRKK